MEMVREIRKGELTFLLRNGDPAQPRPLSVYPHLSLIWIPGGRKAGFAWSPCWAMELCPATMPCIATNKIS